MNEIDAWHAVLGMTIAYVASFLGLIFAYIGYRRQHKQREDQQ